MATRDRDGPKAPSNHAELAPTDLDAIDRAPTWVEPGARVYLIARLSGAVTVIDLADGEQALIGRAPDTAIVVDDTRVSRHHARLTRNGSLLAVEDLGSRNGTHVNEEIVRGARRALFGGELVRIGPLELTVATAPQASPHAAEGRTEKALAEIAAAGGKATLLRVLVPVSSAARVLGAAAEMLRCAEVVEERDPGEYAVLAVGEPSAGAELSRRLAGSDPELRVSVAHFPSDATDFATLWLRARTPDAVLTLPVASGAIVADPAMVQLYRVAERVAQADSTVLIQGETGSGKEVIAEFIHRMSRRAQGPFVRLNCASLPEALLESELFGHERGAFTGADRRKIGYLEAADRGTLLLDEIGELPLGVQAKLLRALETRRAARLGGTQEIQFDVRFLCATHRDLTAEVAAGNFRQDLYFRVRALSLKVPALRNRPNEIELLAGLFVDEFAKGMGRTPPRIAPTAQAALRSHAWPGNVRELKHAIEHAVVMCETDTIEVRHLPEDVAGGAPGEPKREGMRGEIAELERAKIAAALKEHGGNQTQAAKSLGISRRNLLYKMTKYGLRDRE